MGLNPPGNSLPGRPAAGAPGRFLAGGPWCPLFRLLSPDSQDNNSFPIYGHPIPMADAAQTRELEEPVGRNRSHAVSGPLRFWRPSGVLAPLKQRRELAGPALHTLPCT